MVTNMYLILREEKVMKDFSFFFFSNTQFALERKISLAVHYFKLALLLVCLALFPLSLLKKRTNVSRKSLSC